MAYRVEVHTGRLRIQTSALMARRLNSVIGYVHRHAVMAASGGPYSTGRLASSIYRSGPYIQGWKSSGIVGSHLWYARIVESGAEVHNIFPRGAPRVYRFSGPARRRRPQLRFVWRGRTVFTPHVPMAPSTVGRSHPGQQGKHFMLKSLTKAAVRFHMKLIVENA